MNQLAVSLKRIDYKLYSTLLLFGFLPLIYTTVRIHYLGDLPVEWGFNIASQLVWVNIIYEVIQESILLPIFYFMGKSIDSKLQLTNKIKTGLIFTFTVYSIVSILLVIFTKPLLVFMNQKDELITVSVSYIRLESVAYIFNIFQLDVKKTKN